LELICGPRDWGRGIDTYCSVTAARWKRTVSFPEFVPRLVRTMGVQVWIRSGIAWLRDKPIAAQTWIMNGNWAKIYRLAYHEDFKHLAPDTLLTHMLLRHIVEADNVIEVGNLNGDEPCKKDWMIAGRERRVSWTTIGSQPEAWPG